MRSILMKDTRCAAFLQKMTRVAFFNSVVLILICGVMPSLAVGQPMTHMMHPRVPADQLATVRALTNPLPKNQEGMKRGKMIFEGKGKCIECHGERGYGDGALAKDMNPAPRNFHHPGFWRHRTEGEVFWVVQNGSPGTDMPAARDILSDDEIWSVIRYVRSFSEGRGGGQGMRHERHRGGMGTPGHEGMGGSGHGQCCSESE